MAEEGEAAKPVGYHQKKMSNNNQNNNQTKSSDKKFSLTREETNNLNFRRSVLEYLGDIVQRDIQIFIHQEVVKRLNIDTKDSQVKLSDDATYIEVVPNLVLPKNGKN